MGKIAAFFREQNIPLAVQQKQKVLSLDAQFQQMETERDALKVENLHLKAQVNPLEREVERLKDQIQEMKDKAAAHVEDALDEIAEALLVAIANSSYEFTEIQAAAVTGGPARASYYIGLLIKMKFIIQTTAMPSAYGTRQKGLEYLKAIGKL